LRAVDSLYTKLRLAVMLTLSKQEKMVLVFRYMFINLCCFCGYAIYF